MPAAPRQAQLVPMAPGHHMTPTTPAPPARIVPAATTPFGEHAPEATFSLSGVTHAEPAPMASDARGIEQHVRAIPPSFKALRAAAARQAPAPASVTIPMEEIESPQMRFNLPPSHGELSELAERVRRRTAERLARAAR